MDIFFDMNLACLIFCSSEQLSVNVQAVQITVQEAICGEVLVSRLKKGK